MSISILIAAVAIMWGLHCVGSGLFEIARVISEVTSRDIVIEKEPLRSDTKNGWKATVKM